jgi:rod shape-determining protein MreC
VVEVVPDEFGLNQTAYIEPGADFYDIRHVMVVTVKTNTPDLSDISSEEEEEL